MVRRHKPPEWLRKTAVAAGFSAERLPLLKGVPLLRSADTAEKVRQAHEIGSRVITYVSVMDTFLDGRGGQRLPFKKELAPILCMDERGRFINTPMDNSWRMTRFLVCNNNPLYVEKMLEWVGTQLDFGSDGLFIDNVGCPEECYGEGLHIGYSGYKDIAAEIRGAELYDPTIAKLPVHEHIYPDKSHKYAHKRLLGQIWDMVKERNPENVVILNLGMEDDTFGFGEEADGIMLESYLFSWAWKGRNLSFDQIRQCAERYAPYIAEGGSVYALPKPAAPETRDRDSYFAYAAARLSGFFCEVPAGSEDDPVQRLCVADLGEPSAETVWLDDHAYRAYERGVITLNASDQAGSVEVTLPAGCPAELTELLTGARVSCGQGAQLQLAPQSGQVWTAATG